MRLRDYSNVQRRRYLQRRADAQEFAGLEVLLHLDSFCLGDTVCWGSLIPAFVARHKPKKLWVTTFWPELFGPSDQFEVVDAVGSDTIVCDRFMAAGYDKKSLAHTQHGMLYAARQSLRLPATAEPDRSVFRRYDFAPQPDKIVIAPESTKPIARWEYDGSYGWQCVIDALVARNFQVHNISYERTLKLTGAQNHAGNPDIRGALQHIGEARLFIGLSSGLAWLAWAYRTPVVMIAGFTKFFNEFPCYRVWNPHACTGCFNVFPNIASPCPLFAETIRANECHKTITPEMVLAQVNRALVCYH